MKFLLTALFLVITPIILAQNPCNYDLNTIDSLGVYKETKSCLVHEKVFGNSSQLLFLSLLSDNGTPILKLELIQKSTDFMMPKCFDKNSKLFFQLSNGKFYSFINANEDQCGNLIYSQLDKINNRIVTCNFLFYKNDFEDLKKYPITMMQIRYAGETADYILNKELISEKIKGTFYPENFFIDNYKCIE